MTKRRSFFQLSQQAKALSINEVWKQTYSLFKSKFRYWFTSEEVDELHVQNSDFQVISMEEQFLLRYFAKPERREWATHFLQPAEILSIIQIQTGVRIRQKSLGEALLKHGFEKWRATSDNHQKWVYSVIKLDFSQIHQQQQTAQT